MRALPVIVLAAGCQASAFGGGAITQTAEECAGLAGPGEDIALDRPDHPGRVAAGVRPAWLPEDRALLGMARGDGGDLLAVVSERRCEVGCGPEVLRVVNGEIAERVPVPGATTTVPSPFALEFAVVENHDADGTGELWLGYQITAVQRGDTVSMRSYAVLGTAPLAARWYAAHTVVPHAATGWECHHRGLRAVDLECDGAPDLVMDQTCQIQHCLGDTPDPSCGPAVTYHQVDHHLPDGSYRAEISVRAP